MNYLERSKHLLKNLKVLGCETYEVVNLEKQLGIFLPEAYKEFLLWMGKDPSIFLRGSEIEYQCLVKIQQRANELLNERDLKPLSYNAFVFYIHQGYQFSYFLLDENEDPDVYFFDEVITKGVECLNVSYSKWLATEAEIHCQYQRAKNYEKN